MKAVSGTGARSGDAAADGPIVRPVVVVVDDDALIRSLIRGSLAELDCVVREAGGFTEAIEVLGASDVDVVLLDVGLGREDGYDLLQQYKSDPQHANVPVIMVTGRGSTADVAHGLSLGAHDHITKPFHKAELVARVRAALRVKQLQDELTNKAGELDRLSRVDALTGIGNRRYIDEMQASCMGAAERHGQPLGMLLVDIDRFKDVNDKWGHAAGDEVLEAVAEVLRIEARIEDHVGRWGGDEFLVLLPDTDPQGVLVVAERLRRAVNATELGRRYGVTISLGGASMATGPVERLLRDADRALGEAKRAGRNRAAINVNLDEGEPGTPDEGEIHRV